MHVRLCCIGTRVPISLHFPLSDPCTMYQVCAWILMVSCHLHCSPCIPHLFTSLHSRFRPGSFIKTWFTTPYVYINCNSPLSEEAHCISFLINRFSLHLLGAPGRAINLSGSLGHNNWCLVQSDRRT